jgi:hypothetical protein
VAARACVRSARLHAAAQCSVCMCMGVWVRSRLRRAWLVGRYSLTRTVGAFIYVELPLDELSSAVYRVPSVCKLPYFFPNIPSALIGKMNL